MSIAIAIASLIILVGLWSSISAITGVYASKANRWAKRQEVDNAQDNAKVKEDVNELVQSGTKFMTSDQLEKYLDDVISGKIKAEEIPAT